MCHVKCEIHLSRNRKWRDKKHKTQNIHIYQRQRGGSRTVAMTLFRFQLKLIQRRILLESKMSITLLKGKFNNFSRQLWPNWWRNFRIIRKLDMMSTNLMENAFQWIRKINYVLRSCWVLDLQNYRTGLPILFHFFCHSLYRWFNRLNCSINAL